MPWECFSKMYSANAAAMKFCRIFPHCRIPYSGKLVSVAVSDNAAKTYEGDEKKFNACLTLSLDTSVISCTHHRLDRGERYVRWWAWGLQLIGLLGEE